MLKELMTERVDDADIDAIVARDAGEIDLPAARQLLIRRAQMRRERDQLAETKKAVAQSYDERMATLARREEEIDRQIEGYIRFQGGEAIRLPDVGTAFLRERAASAQVVRAELTEEARREFIVTTTTLDETGLKHEALKMFNETGDLEPIPGVKIIPPGEQVIVR